MWMELGNLGLRLLVDFLEELSSKVLDNSPGAQ